MGSPEEVEFKFNELAEEKGFGDVGFEIVLDEEGGWVSQERVRKQDCRIMEKEVA